MERILSHENLGFGMIYLKFNFNYCSMLLSLIFLRFLEKAWKSFTSRFSISKSNKLLFEGKYI